MEIENLNMGTTNIFIALIWLFNQFNNWGEKGICPPRGLSIAKRAEAEAHREVMQSQDWRPGISW